MYEMYIFAYIARNDKLRSAIVRRTKLSFSGCLNSSVRTIMEAFLETLISAPQKDPSEACVFYNKVILPMRRYRAYNLVAKCRLPRENVYLHI